MMNKIIQLARRPVGKPTQEDWTLLESPVDPLESEQVLVKVEYLSIDPAMRGWMDDAYSYIDPVVLGATMRAGGIGEVLESKSYRFKAGDKVIGTLNTQSHAILNALELTKVDPDLAPLPTYLGALGMPGMTAYFGLTKVAEMKPSEVVLISGGAGAVGAVAGQIAKDAGCQVIGIAGGPEKCRYMKEIGFDGVIDYKSDDVRGVLQKLAPSGIDIYFDNVGGEILDIALSKLRFQARIAVCGAISQYNSQQIMGPQNYLSLLINRAKMQGFIVFDYSEYYTQAIDKLSQLYFEKKLKTKEHIVNGLESFNQALNMLFIGENFGKLILKI